MPGLDPAVGHWVERLASREGSSESVPVPSQRLSQVGTMGRLCGKGPVSHQAPTPGSGWDLSRACPLCAFCIGPVMSGFHGTCGGNYGL